MNELSCSHIKQIEADCLYANVFKRYSGDELIEALKKSGNIEEFRSELDEMAMRDVRFLTMPIRHVGGDTDLPQAVIVSTGSYSPVHAGHIAIMNQARAYVESLGYQVLQGVLSASHDAYVSIKNGGAAKLHIGKRSQKIYEAIQGSDWLTFDRFEGEGVSCAINFSTVIERVRNMVLAHNPRAKADLKVFYVFGSDNAGFADAFVGNDLYEGICVDRGGHEIDHIKQKMAGEKSVHFIAAEDSTTWISSTKVRAAGAVQQEELISDDDIYLIRTDCVPQSVVDELAAIIRSHVVPGIKQRQFSSRDLELERVGTVCLDKFVRGEYNIDTSRVFEVSSAQISANGMTSLIEDVAVQASRIPEGSYVLVDDDSVSGFTMNKIAEILEQSGVSVVERRTLISQVLSGNERVYDVIDARDFLIGAEKCGLVVDLFGTTVRVPYVFPFVNLVTRARVLPERQLLCSREIWEMNRRHAGHRLVADLEPSQRMLYQYLGFHGRVGEVCDYFLALIDNYLGANK